MIENEGILIGESLSAEVHILSKYQSEPSAIWEATDNSILKIANALPLSR